MRLHGIQAALLALTLLLNTDAQPADAARFSVALKAKHAGLVLLDSEALDVHALVAGAPAGATEASVDFEIAEREGPWRNNGSLKVPLTGGSGDALLPLKLPGRGQFALKVRANCGAAAAACDKNVSVLFTPHPIDPKSPWGIFFTQPEWFDKDNPHALADLAEQHRLLGASWSRVPFFLGSFTFKINTDKDGKKSIADFDTTYKRYTNALRKEGIFIMANIGSMPKELSSAPDDNRTGGWDGGPFWSISKPSDYALWDAVIEKLAAAYKDDIQIWELYNEPNFTNVYWRGTPEELVEAVAHTSAAVRKGNPDARVAGLGIVGRGSDGFNYGDRLLALGIGKHLDIWTVHYTDNQPDDPQRWVTMLEKYKLHLALWNSEEETGVPVRNLASPIEMSFKFIHIKFSDMYGEESGLALKDMTLQPIGVAFSVGAHCLGACHPSGADKTIPGYELYYFKRGEETIAVFHAASKQPAGQATGVVLNIEALDAAKPPTATDIWGRSTALKIENGTATVKLDKPWLFINEAKTVKLAEVSRPQLGGGALFEAESGKWSTGWSVNDRPGFSNGKVVEIWQDQDPDPKTGYWVDLPISVPADGKFELLISGPGSSVGTKASSPFSWSIDSGAATSVERELPLIKDVPGLKNPLVVLGNIDLTKGEHTFHLKLLRRREEPDTRWSLWFDALVLRARK